MSKRKAQLTRSLDEASLDARAQDERILHIIPARNIETWLAYLSGDEVDETTSSPKLELESGCAPMIATLHAMCQASALRAPAPPSLERACAELRARLT